VHFLFKYPTLGLLVITSNLFFALLLTRIYLKSDPKELPIDRNPLKKTVENIRDPLDRFFEGEVNFGIKLL